MVSHTHLSHILHQSLANFADLQNQHLFVRKQIGMVVLEGGYSLAWNRHTHVTLSYHA